MWGIAWAISNLMAIFLIYFTGHKCQYKLNPCAIPQIGMNEKKTKYVNGYKLFHGILSKKKVMNGHGTRLLTHSLIHNMREHDGGRRGRGRWRRGWRRLGREGAERHTPT